jgi:hypothetical protein
MPATPLAIDFHSPFDRIDITAAEVKFYLGPDLLVTVPHKAMFELGDTLTLKDITGMVAASFAT